jgi:protein-S-isoprenylcysteine O-methyltransferase Ste14
MFARIFEKQVWHLLALIILLGAVGLTSNNMLSMSEGELWGMSTGTWLIIALVVPIIHQVFVWLIWRTHLENGWLTKRFPKNGFQVYNILFLLMLTARPISVLLLAIANQGTISLSAYILFGLALFLAIPSIYLNYSMMRYFGLKRAFGADHFFQEYREMPLVKDGIFRYSNNGMYIFGFLNLWVIALLFASQAALVAALFNHLYIWVHYYSTEKPDMLRIYGDG